MAYILGWAGHLAADRTFKPIFRIADLAYYVKGLPGPSNASVYHDTIIMREVFANGNHPPFHKTILAPLLQGHPAASVVPVQQIEASFAMQQQNDMAGFKRFLTPSRNSEKTFTDNTQNEMQEYKVNLDRYTAAYHNPDPTKLRQFILKPNFYDRKDPIILLARQLQYGRNPTIQLDEALKNTSEQSQYAQALKLGYDFLMSCSDYFTNKIDLEEAKVRMRTHQAHKNPLEYYIEQAKKAMD